MDETLRRSVQLQADYAKAERAKEDRRHTLKRRVDEVDAAIDQVVYQLYGLTEKEINIIETAGKCGSTDVQHV